MRTKNSKTFGLLVLIACLLVISVNTLKINHQQKNQKHNVEVFRRNLYHRMGVLFTYQGDQTSVEDVHFLESFFMDFFFFMLEDQDIFGEMMQGKITNKSVQKIRDYLIKNDKLITMIFSELQKVDQCLKKLNLTLEQKRKIFGHFFDGIDWIRMFNQQNYDKDGINQEQKKKICDSITNDKDLGPQVSECLHKICQKLEQRSKNAQKQKQAQVKKSSN